MKSSVKVFYALAFLAMISACAGTEGTTRQPKDFSNYTDLASALRSIGSLQISGTGDNIIVSMRGQSSINLNTQPLFVVNNIPVGNNYSDANGMINPSEITSINVLRGASATTIYGEDGNSGVILIRTKVSK